MEISNLFFIPDPPPPPPPPPPEEDVVVVATLDERGVATGLVANFEGMGGEFSSVSSSDSSEPMYMVSSALLR